MHVRVPTTGQHVVSVMGFYRKCATSKRHSAKHSSAPAASSLTNVTVPVLHCATHSICTTCVFSGPAALLCTHVGSSPPHACVVAPACVGCTHQPFTLCTTHSATLAFGALLWNNTGQSHARWTLSPAPRGVCVRASSGQAWLIWRPACTTAPCCTSTPATCTNSSRAGHSGS